MIVEVQLFIFPKDDTVSTDCRVLASARGFLKLPQEPLTIVRTPGHKPRFAGRDNLHFSVSHSGDLFLCAVCSAPVGVDVERHKACDFAGIARRFFHPDEYAYLEANHYRDFFTIWSAKESYVKYTGEGIDDRFSQFSTVSGGRLAEQVGNTGIRFIPLREGYSACVCAQHLSSVCVKFVSDRL